MTTTHNATQGHTTGSLAELLKAQLRGDPARSVRWLNTVAQAAPDELTFARDTHHARELARSRAAGAIITQSVVHEAPQEATLLVVEDADHALITLLELFARAIPADAPPPGIHPSASIDPSATIDPVVHVGPGCVIGPRVRIAQGAVLVANVYLGADASVGKGTILRHGVTIETRCSVGDACVLHPGVVVGADGFGFRPAPGGMGLVKIPHIGAVRIGNAVEIGANSTIDRGKFGDTLIGDGTKLDNLVQIGHNCIVGRSCVLCGQAGLGGSCTLGDGVMIGGQSGAKDNIHFGAGARLAGKSGTMRDIPAGESWMGNPAWPARTFMRQYSTTSRAELMFDELFERLEALEAQRKA